MVKKGSKYDYDDVDIIVKNIISCLMNVSSVWSEAGMFSDH